MPLPVYPGINTLSRDIFKLGKHYSFFSPVSADSLRAELGIALMHWQTAEKREPGKLPGKCFLNRLHLHANSQIKLRAWTQPILSVLIAYLCDNLHFITVHL